MGCPPGRHIRVREAYEGDCAKVFPQDDPTQCYGERGQGPLTSDFEADGSTVAVARFGCKIKWFHQSADAFRPHIDLYDGMRLHAYLCVACMRARAPVCVCVCMVV